MCSFQSQLFTMAEVSKMEKILNNPGFEHLAEIIFGNLDHDHLDICEQINESSKQILINPMFWIRKFKFLSKENQKDWIKVIQLEKNSAKEKSISLYLKWKLKKNAGIDLPCYSSQPVQDNFRNRIWRISNQYQISYHDEEVVKILAPLTNNLAYTDSNYYGRTPINRAAMSGHTEIVKILAPLTDNPNAPDKFGGTPIYWAALKGHTEIVKILAPLTNNPNAPNESGRTPSSFTQRAEIRRILESYNNSRKRNYVMIDYPQEQAPIQETIKKNFTIQHLLSSLDSNLLSK